jgi:hypothetical protein
MTSQVVLRWPNALAVIALVFNVRSQSGTGTWADATATSPTRPNKADARPHCSMSTILSQLDCDWWDDEPFGTDAHRRHGVPQSVQ